jgi:hypothetical protein
MADFEIRVDLSGLLAISPIVKSGVFGNLAAAVERVTMTGAERWRESVMKAPLWQGERKACADTIKWRMTGPYSGEIVSDYRYVEDIENGRPPRDLKKMLDTSMKVRTSAKGKRYLIIPFRHNTPGNDALGQPMAEHVYAEAKQLSPSRITGQGFRQSGTGAFDVSTKRRYLVPARKYQWGSSLPAGMVPKLKPQHKTDPAAGMYRFETSPGKQRSSSYVTFRVMSEDSDGWIVPAKAGLHLAQIVAEAMRTDAETIFAGAIQDDIAPPA